MDVGFPVTQGGFIRKKENGALKQRAVGQLQI
jgi:hypothetical protein